MMCDIPREAGEENATDDIQEKNCKLRRRRVNIAGPVSGRLARACKLHFTGETCSLTAMGC